ncbi:MAG: MFS transporter [Desulfovibrio sp.]|nr:MFS transporter [Desulfovibrio sp.]MBI4957859.1 MFS transporter [Desulfovibrio sp.]
MVPLMLTSVSVALPAMGNELNASAQQLGLVEQLYALSLAMTMLTFGRLGDLVGRRKVFLTGFAWFTLLTCSIGFATNIDVVIALRLLQGTGASLLLCGSMALVASVFPVQKRGRAFGIVGAFTYAGLTLGPVLGGYVTSHLGWRFVFLTVVPFGLLGSLLCLTRMRGEWRADKPGTMDWLGGLVYAAGLALFMVGASHLGQGMAPVLMVLAGVACLLGFGVLETRLKHPLLDVATLLANRFFSLSCLAAMGTYAATFGVTFFMSLYLQYVRDMSPHEAGLLLLLQPLMQVLVSPVAGLISDRVHPVRLSNLGMALSSLGLLLAACTIGPATPTWLIVVELALIGLGIGVFITPNTVIIMGSVEQSQYGVASGMIGTMRTLGMVTSMTTATVIFSLLMHGQSVAKASLPDFLESMRISLVIFTLFSSCGMLASFGRKRGRNNTGKEQHAGPRDQER